jgi:hypothetical protein
MYIKFWQQHCNVYYALKPLPSGGIRTQDLLFCPLCMPRRQGFGHFFIVKFWTNDYPKTTDIFYLTITVGGISKP